MAENLGLVSKVQQAMTGKFPSLATQPETNRPLIVDVSHWSGVVDFHKGKANGIAGVIIKFTDGTTVTKYAEENYRGAKDAGLPVGGYHWLYKSVNISTGRQARFYLDFLKDHPCEIRPTVDFEWTRWNGAESNPGINDLYGFATPFEDGYGKRPMIYTAPGYWNDPKYGSRQAKWAEYPLWTAQYNVKAPTPFHPWVNEGYKIWQFTPNGDGVKYGQNPQFSKSADLNYFNGTLEEFNAWLDVKPTPDPIPDPIPDPVPDFEKRIKNCEVRIDALQKRLDELDGGK